MSRATWGIAMTSKRKTRIFTGKLGHYSLEFEDENSSVRGKAIGPVPFGSAGWVSVVAEACGGDDDGVELLLIEKVRGYEAATPSR